MAERYAVLDLDSPEYDQFADCGQRLYREATRIEFSSIERAQRWINYRNGQVRPWLVVHPAPLPITTPSGFELATFNLHPYGQVVVMTGNDLKDNHVKVVYADRYSRAFDGRMAALKDCGLRNDWWDTVIVPEVEHAEK